MHSNYSASLTIAAKTLYGAGVVAAQVQVAGASAQAQVSSTGQCFSPEKQLVHGWVPEEEDFYEIRTNLIPISPK